VQHFRGDDFFVDDPVRIVEADKLAPMVRFCVARPT
jgi:hypothetical protein